MVDPRGQGGVVVVSSSSWWWPCGGGRGGRRGGVVPDEAGVVSSLLLTAATVPATAAPPATTATATTAVRPPPREAAAAKPAGMAGAPAAVPRTIEALLTTGARTSCRCRLRPSRRWWARTRGAGLLEGAVHHLHVVLDHLGAGLRLRQGGREAGGVLDHLDVVPVRSALARKYTRARATDPPARSTRRNFGYSSASTQSIGLWSMATSAVADDARDAKATRACASSLAVPPACGNADFRTVAHAPGARLRPAPGAPASAPEAGDGLSHAARAARSRSPCRGRVRPRCRPTPIRPAPAPPR